MFLDHFFGRFQLQYNSLETLHREIKAWLDTDTVKRDVKKLDSKTEFYEGLVQHWNTIGVANQRYSIPYNLLVLKETFIIDNTTLFEVIIEAKLCDGQIGFRSKVVVLRPTQLLL